MIELLLPRYLVPVRPAGQVFEGQCVAVDHVTGRIVDILGRSEASAKYPQARLTSLAEHALLPGLINMHTHSPMSLLRGYADDLELDTWLQQHIWPAEARWVNADFVALGTELSIAEMLRGGTTCFNENYFHPDRIAEVVVKSGMRACIGIPVIEMETSWASTAAEYLERGLALISTHSSDSRLSFALAPHSMYTVDEATLVQLGDLSREQEMRIHMHMLETRSENCYAREHQGSNLLEYADRLGLLNERLIAVHMAHLSDHEIAMIQEKRVHVVHCPQSNLKLGSGICPLAKLLSAGVNVSIGTDGAASNNDLDLLEELRTAALLAKGVTHDPRVVGAVQALELVTVNAARALGIDDMVGSIEVGKQADLCAIDLSAPRTQPVHNVISQVVYSAAASQVSDVWVDGQRLLEDSRLAAIDQSELIDRVSDWADRTSRVRPAQAAMA